MVRHACKAGGWGCGEFRDEAWWTGFITQHCTVCGELFLSTDAGDVHRRGSTCCDPAQMARRDGSPMFEKVPRQNWEPPYAWRLFKPNRKPWRGSGRPSWAPQTAKQPLTHTPVTP